MPCPRDILSHRACVGGEHVVLNFPARLPPLPDQTSSLFLSILLLLLITYARYNRKIRRMIKHAFALMTEKRSDAFAGELQRREEFYSGSSQGDTGQCKLR